MRKNGMGHSFNSNQDIRKPRNNKHGKCTGSAVR